MTDSSRPTTARGRRLHWPDMPHEMRQKIELRLGHPVVAWESQPGGFSPGLASRLQVEDGSRVFVKAVHPSANPHSPDMHRREARIAAALPDSVPAPRFRWSIDEGQKGWVVLAFEDVEGQHPREPWERAQLEAVLDAMLKLSRLLTPSPIATESASDLFAKSLNGWRTLKDEPPPALDSWSTNNLDALADVERTAPLVVAGTTLLHMDIRSDNILVAGDRVYFVDWPHAHIGAPWVDIVTMAPSVTLQGGPEPEDLVSGLDAFDGADPDAITAAVASLAGYFVQRSLLPEPPELPTLRAFQAAQGEIACRWLARRLVWPER